MPNTSIQTSGKLFELVQLLKLFSDLKAFPDSFPRPGMTVEQIQQDFEIFLTRFYDQNVAVLGDLGTATGTDRLDKILANVTMTLKLRMELLEWVRAHFLLPEDVQVKIPPSQSMEDHIEKMWQYLVRQPGEIHQDSSLLPLKRPQIIPGGRFGEGYYWDSYFTALGLLVTNRVEMLRDMVDNFADLIRSYGHIPNGNRLYYLSRSQPPFFAAMLDLLDNAVGESASDPYFEVLQLEYRYWLDQNPDGSPRLATGSGKVVQMGEHQLTRYRDELDSPRPEAYTLDVEAGLEVAPEQRAKLYRDIRSAAESGWDFTSRFMVASPRGEYRLSSHRTTDLIPVDLNAILVSLESKLARLAERQEQTELAAYYRAAAQRRKQALIDICWSEADGWFFDRLISDGSSTGHWNLAGAYPLYFQVLDAEDPRDQERAARMVKNIQEKFLQPGGVVSTLTVTDQQWDWPNGWAPHQWIVAVGVLNYGFEEIARQIAGNFVDLARRTFNSTGKMMEKYDVCDMNRVGGGGEYPNQDGFGWTNGVVTAFQALLEGKHFWK